MATDCHHRFENRVCNGPKWRSQSIFHEVLHPVASGRYRGLVEQHGVVIACAAACLVVLSACSSTPAEPALRSGELAVGTASVTVNGQDLGKTSAVSCVRNGNLTTISTGDVSAGTTTVLDNSHGLTTKSVSIRNLGGFTGSYWQGLDGSGNLKTSGATFDLDGEAYGFNADNPSARTTGTFRIKVAC